ncbi:MAG: hypothetical protein ACLUQ0_05490 [Enterococcus italicus]|uniref:hypothetical protein n=1 Tax=Enterococcus italicus TaxID=246144 RepID=UPI00399197F2
MADLTNEFALQQQSTNGIMAQASASREMEEVKGQIFMAKQFPRNPFDAERRILDACKRPSLAQSAVYNYPRGKQMVSGPSIRLAEVLAQNWGNLSFGIKELQQLPGESVAMAYAWDLETNTRQEKVFTVKHERHTKQGVTYLKDPRDIYELVANNGARRVRACILGVIPGDIVETAVEECNKTMSGANDKPLKERLDIMFKLFKEKYDITQEMIESRFGYKATAFTEKNGVDLANIYNSIKDGISKVDDWFEVATHEKKESSKLETEFKNKKDPLKEAKAADSNGAQQEELL